MTKEEIDYAKSCVQEIRDWGDTAVCCKDLESFIEQVNKLQKENEKQNKILDILKPYILIDDTDGEYKLIIGTIDYDITKEQDELLKEWEEND